MIRTCLISLALLLSTPMQASPEQCGLKLQVAVGAEVSAEQVAIIINESVNKNITFLKLFLCLVAVESAFDPEALSGKQAYGLTQTTAIARKEVANRWKGNEPILPIGKDVYFGSAYLSLCLQDFGDNWPMALACYNGGPTQANLLRSGRRMCNETANYVSRVWKLYEEHCQ